MANRHISRQPGRTVAVNRRPRPRAGRVLLWILLIVVALIVLSVLFGGFQKGTNSGLNMLRGGPHGYVHATRLS
jgi:autotransporter translocation and assembly factor TamB